MMSVMFKGFDVIIRTTMETSKHLNLLDLKMAIFVLAIVLIVVRMGYFSQVYMGQYENFK